MEKSMKEASDHEHILWNAVILIILSAICNSKEMVSFPTGIVMKLPAGVVDKERRMN